MSGKVLSLGGGSQPESQWPINERSVLGFSLFRPAWPGRHFPLSSRNPQHPAEPPRRGGWGEMETSACSRLQTFLSEIRSQ